ncbi:MAG: hypothetical protein R3C59_17720 [Planctomycetaceae bacterium]
MPSPARQLCREFLAAVDRVCRKGMAAKQCVDASDADAPSSRTPIVHAAYNKTARQSGTLAAASDFSKPPWEVAIHERTQGE